MLVLCGLTFMLHHAAGSQIRAHVTKKRVTIAILLFVVLGVPFFLVALSVWIVSYGCLLVTTLLARFGRVPNVGRRGGFATLALLVLVAYPWLNAMYFRGTGASYLDFDHKRYNLFFDVNRAGFRGPPLPIQRGATSRLLFMGDSTTFGYPYRVEEGYPHLVGVQMARADTPAEIINGATIGHSVGQIRYELPYFLRYEPDLVFLMVGIHYQRAYDDLERIAGKTGSRDTGFCPLFGVPVLFELFALSITTSPLANLLSQDGEAFDGDRESFGRTLSEVIQLIQDAGAEPIVIEYPTSGADRRIQAEIEAVCDQHGIRFLALWDALGDQIETSRNDEIHPDRAGHVLIAEAVSVVAIEALASRARAQ